MNYLLDKDDVNVLEEEEDESIAECVYDFKLEIANNQGIKIYDLSVLNYLYHKEIINQLYFPSVSYKYSLNYSSI